MRSTLIGSGLRYATAAATIAVIAACGRDITTAQHNEAHRIEITDRSQAERPVVATWVRGSGWQQGSVLPTISHSSATPGRIAIGVLMYNDEGQSITLSKTGSYQAVWLAHQSSPAGLLVNNDSAGERFHGDHLHIYAAPGQTGTGQVVIMQWHGTYPAGHEDLITPPLPVTVTN